MKKMNIHKKFSRSIIVSVLVVAVTIVTSIAISARMSNVAITEKELIINDVDVTGDTNFVSYVGTWASAADSNDQYHLDEHWSNYNSSWVAGNEPGYTITFVGTKIELYGNKAPGLGVYKISIDEEEVGTISATASARTPQQLLYTSPVLAQGTHKIKVSAMVSSAKNIQFDYAKVSYEEKNETQAGNIGIEADPIYKDQAGHIRLTFSEIPEDQSFYAAEFIVKFDQDILTYRNVSSNQDSIIVKAKETADGELHVLVSAREMINNQTIIDLEMGGKAITDASIVLVEKAELSDEDGTIIPASTEHATVNVVVMDSYVPATAINVDKDQVELALGESAIISATIVPDNATNKDISWTSSNPDVADVAAGKITAKAVGTAVITATAEAGKVTKDIQVTVRDSAVEPEDTTLAKSILKSAIDKATVAEATKEFQKLAPSVQALILTTHSTAQIVYDNPAATNMQCMDAWINLANALQFLDFQADKEQLLSLIETCNKINTDEYTEGVEEFKAALIHAQSVYDNKNALQASIDAASKRLEVARAGLAKNEDTVDKSVLESMISAIENKIGDGDKYNKDNGNWTAFTKALAEAKAVINNATATQVDVNQAAMALNEAYLNIRLLPSEEQLAELNGFIAAVNGINRSSFTKAQLQKIDETAEKVKALINDFDEKQFPSTQKEMAATLEMINDVIGKTPSKPGTHGSGASNPAAQPNTGDHTTIAAGLLTLFVSGCIVLIMHRKRNKKTS